MQERFRPMYARALRLRRKLLRLADDFPCDPDAELWRKAADEAGNFAAHIRADRRPAPPTPAVELILAASPVDVAVDLVRFKQGQAAFSTPPRKEGSAAQ